MKIQYVDVEEIDFIKTEYSNALYESIERIGLSFNIKTKIVNDSYICIDGHKRLSVISDLKQKGINIKIGMIVSNTSDGRSNDCSRGRNTH